MELTKTQINKIGKEIRESLKNGKQPNSESLAKIQEFRTSHHSALLNVFGFLVEKSKIQNKGCIVVYRLKRIDTIVRKLTREPTMALATMHDIAGCRSILDTNSQIFNIVDEFQKNKDFKVIKTYDYISHPRPSGYISYHLKIKCLKEDKLIEVQLRTRKQHYWATLVEITDLNYGIRIKEGDSYQKLNEFHHILSNVITKISQEDIIKLIEIEIEFKYVEDLITLFADNYIKSLSNWLNAVYKEPFEYLIIDINDNKEPDYAFFRTSEEAEVEYFKRFKINESNLVLIHVNKPSLKNVSLAYSNYVLSSHPFIQAFIKILNNNILSMMLVKERKFNKLIEYNELKQKLSSLIIKSYKPEIDFLEKLIENEIKDNKINERTAEEVIRIFSDLKYRKNEFSELEEKYFDEFKSKIDLLKRRVYINNLIIFKNKIIILLIRFRYILIPLVIFLMIYFLYKIFNIN